jgi:hypothetical protein
MTETIDWRLPMPPGFHWPDGIRAAACFTFDVDAESPILYEYPESAAWLDVMSHQAYGARTGIARILRVLDRRRIRSTFFIPGYSAERWPAICRSIRDAGHEIAHHGYLHEGAHGATPAIEEARLLRGLASLDEILGVRPSGYLGADVRDAGDPCPSRFRLRLRPDGCRSPVRPGHLGGARRADAHRAARSLVAR